MEDSWGLFGIHVICHASGKEGKGKRGEISHDTNMKGNKIDLGRAAVILYCRAVVCCL